MDCLGYIKYLWNIVLHNYLIGAIVFIRVTSINKGILKVNYKAMLNCKKHNSSRC